MLHRELQIEEAPDDIDDDEEAPDDLSRIFTDAPSVCTATGSILGSMGGNRLKTAS